ncbi:hypothetical protein [Candidatus Borrarchaeum sp.]|uniref:hypothetical protein n=1 Tax=Candidatus Borrarchaeum sp. TaxID=2846742 RepID=UPI00257B7CEE|nr:hypothetical protein [Candidatus Borrarchaeum sp.]
MGEYIDDLFSEIQTSPSKMEEVVQAINTILENFINVVFKAVESLSNEVAGIKSEFRQSLNNLNTKMQSIEGRMSLMRTAGPAAPMGPTSTGLPPPTTPGPSEPFLTPPPTAAGPGGPGGPESPPPVTGATLRMQLNSELKKAFSRIKGGGAEE